MGEVAGRLGVAPSTVRMWGSRYGLTASAKSPGGHRRYTAQDVDRMLRMQQAVVAGADPAAAAAGVVGGDGPTTPRPRRGGPGGAVLAVPGVGKDVRGIARAASRLDETTVTKNVLRSLLAKGTVSTWNELLRPVLVAAGTRWQQTGSGIEVEHLLTQAVTTAFAQYLAQLTEVAQVSPVMLAGGPHEDHVLALHAVRAGLFERGVPVRFLGPRTPMSALTGVARLTRAPAVLIWMSLRDTAAIDDLPAVASAHRRLVTLVGGPGWTGLDTAPVTVCTSLEQAIDELQAAWTAAVQAPAQ